MTFLFHPKSKGEQALLSTQYVREVGLCALLLGVGVGDCAVICCLHSLSSDLFKFSQHAFGNEQSIEVGRARAL